MNEGGRMYFLLWIAAVALAIWGVVTLLNGSILMGIVLLVAAALVGPGGYSIFRPGRGSV
jgi:hypothetical protein